MSDYTPTGNPIAITRAASSDIRNEFSAIATAITSKSNKAGQAYTGAHDFTGATISVPTPTTATAAATKAYVDALSVAAGNVPAGGSVGQALIKTGAADYAMAWGQAGTGMGGTTATGSVTLTASSSATMTITPSAPGLYVTLPDATTCTKADNLYSIYNAGDYDYGVKDSTGTQIGWVRARTGAMIGLSDSSTAAGVWAYYGLEKTGITASYVNSTLANMTASSTMKRIAIDANRTCLLFGGTDCYAIVYDASTQTWGSATLVRASVASGAFVGVLSATNQMLVVSNDSTTAMEAVTLTISGTTITVNSGTKGTATLAGNYSSFGQLIAVGSSFVVSYGRATTTPATRAISISGTTPTIGSESACASASTTPPVLFVSGSVVRRVSASTGTLYAQPVTVSGTTQTAGTDASTGVTAASFRAFLNGNGNIVCHYINTTHYATIFKLTGTTEAASSVNLGTAPTSIQTHADYVNIGAGKNAFLYDVSSTTWYANILTDTAGTASAGTEISQAVLGNVSVVSGLTSNGNTARFAVATTSSSGATQHVSLDCSGSSPTISSIQQVTYYATDGGAANSVPASSDAYGVKAPKTLIAGARAHIIGNSVSYDLSMTTAGIQFNKPLPLFCATTSVKGVSGANSESFIANTFNNSTTGFVISRVEAAA